MPWVGPPCNCYVMLDPQATHNRAWSGEAFTLSKKLPKIEKKFFKGIDILPKAGMLRVSDRGIYRPYVLLEFNLYNLLLTTQQADGATRVPPYLSHLHSSVPGYPPPIMPGTDLFCPHAAAPPPADNSRDNAFSSAAGRISLPLPSRVAYSCSTSREHPGS